MEDYASNVNKAKRNFELMITKIKEMRRFLEKYQAMENLVIADRCHLSHYISDC